MKMRKSKMLGHLAPPTYEDLRLTIHAREALERAGNVVREMRTPDGSEYAIDLMRPPAGLVVARVSGTYHTALRTGQEQPWPGECDAAWHERGAWLPCPECGFALVWCEAGFVPGFRICLAGHASQLDDDGRAAERQPQHDASALACTKPIR